MRGWLAKLTTLSFGSSAATSSGQSGLDFSTNPSITTIGASAFKGTAFSEVNLTALPADLSVGPDAFSAIIGLTEVTLTNEQAKIVNPGVFSGVSEDDPSKPSDTWTLTVNKDSNGQTPATSYTPTTWPTTTVTVANNLNRLEGVTTMDLSASPISTLEGGVLFGNASITKLVLPATASSWKLTEVGEYSSSPIGYSSDKSGQGLVGGKGSIEFLNFKTGASNEPATSFQEINWQLVANILNMFGRVEGSDRDNLSIWSDNFSDGLLTGEMLKDGEIWEGVSPGGRSTKSPINDKTQSATLTHNGLVWKYTNQSNSITLTIDQSNSNKNPNAYRAGYTGNQFASYQVGFGADNKIKTDAQVTVTLTLVKSSPSPTQKQSLNL